MRFRCVALLHTLTHSPGNESNESNEATKAAAGVSPGRAAQIPFSVAAGEAPGMLGACFSDEPDRGKCDEQAGDGAGGGLVGGGRQAQGRRRQEGAGQAPGDM